MVREKEQVSEDKEFIGIDEAVSLLGTSKPTFYRWLKTGRVSGMKVGRNWRFYKDDIERLILVWTGDSNKHISPLFILRNICSDLILLFLMLHNEPVRSQ